MGFLFAPTLPVLKLSKSEGLVTFQAREILMPGDKDKLSAKAAVAKADSAHHLLLAAAHINLDGSILCSGLGVIISGHVYILILPACRISKRAH